MPRFLLSVLSTLLVLSLPAVSTAYPEDFEILQLDDPLDVLSATAPLTHAAGTLSMGDTLEDAGDFREIRPLQRDFEILSVAGEYGGLGEEGEDAMTMKFGGLYDAPYAGGFSSPLNALNAFGSFGYSSSPAYSFASPLSSYGSFGGAFESSASKKRLPTLHLQAAPLMAPSVEISPVTSYVIREQPIKAPRTVIQPIIHQRLVEQPITKTRIVTQPVIRRLITQPVVQPHLIKTTQVQEKIIDQPITVPKITRQDIVKQVLIEQPMTAKPITRPTIVERRQPKLSVSFMGKNAARPLSKVEALQAAHPFGEGLKANWNLQNYQNYQNDPQEMQGGLQNWAMF